MRSLPVQKWQAGALAGAMILVPAMTGASTRYDPRLRFQTISTQRFDIHYHQGEEEEARRLATIAESVASSLDRTLGPPSGRVQVILVDQSDLSNGWATPLPYNTIEITAAAPGGSSLLGNTTDWLRLVFTHEYTHVVHLSRGRGWIGGLRRVFGRMPLLYPNLFLPQWQIEGLATYEESARTGQGRVKDGSFRAILDLAAARSAFEPLDRAGGGLVDWPSGHAPYVYGGFFHQYLADRYGEESLTQLTDDTAGRIPYLGSRAFKKVFRRSLGELWEDFEIAARRALPAFGPSVTRLSRHGFTVTGPRFGRDGRIYYSVVNPHGFPALLSLTPDEPTPRKVANRYLGNQISFAGSRLVYDATEVENQVGLQSDLYAVEPDGAANVRLTRDARAADPDVSPDGRTIVCTIQRPDRRDLAALTLAPDRGIGRPVTIVSERHAHFGRPRWSPDGRTIAAERETGVIVLIDPAGTRAQQIVAASAGGRSITPAWMPDGTLLFASERESEGFRLYRTNVQTQETWRLEGTGPDARSPDVSPDGRTLIFVGYDTGGYDLFSLPLAAASWTPVTSTTPRTASANPVVAAESPAVAARRYSPAATLAPRFWTPIVETDNDELQLGAAVASADALGRHSYFAEAGWSASRGRPDWQVAYAYDRWRPTFFVDASEDTDPFRNGDIQTREVNAGLLVPFRRVRWTQSLLAALHASTDRLLCQDCPDGEPTRITRRSVRGGWRMQASRSYGYSISAEDGWSTIATTELIREAFGDDGDGGAATIDARGYVPVVPRHGVIAMRVAGASTWGDDRVRRVFSASGSGPQPGGLTFGSDAIGLLRGVDELDVAGRHAFVANVDYRFPLRRFDRGAGTIPVFAQVVHAAVFMDAGNAWDERFRRSDVLVSLGAELSFDAVLGYTLPLTFTTGGAWVSKDRGFTAFGRVGRAF
jgi:WD40-like Beta Propeller Repeat